MDMHRSGHPPESDEHVQTVSMLVEMDQNLTIQYYGKIMEVIDALDSTDSSAVAAVKSLPSEQLLEDILFIDSNFKTVSKSITLLESSKLQLSEALNIVYNVSQTVIQNNNSLISEKVKCHDKSSEVDVLKVVTFRSSNMHLLYRVMSNSSRDNCQNLMHVRSRR
ncbi:hypothetical protein ANN_16846 [Periplaneta americana]|uniref:Uncharacterized protein n=1 Tax=Periplaneta americana TaxID=6978 RepID=A0ABQ8SSD1_PERAM|nr:hypothetical protein ANN_16846 [Periplaneta americana]